jgi:hypothetical protein
MTQVKNHSELLGRIAGEGGDFYIGAQAISNKKFTHIEVGTDGATLVGVQIGNQDVKTAKNYPAAMPGGYLMIAGGDKYFNHIEFSAGWGEGLLLSEEE